MSLTESLVNELHVHQGKSLVFHVGEVSVQIPSKDVTGDADKPYSVGSELKVEAVLPASVLQKYEVVMDYRNRELTLAHPGTLKPEGVPVPFHSKKETGLVAVNALIDSKSYAVTIDNGSAYSWFRQTTARAWLTSHPEWERGVGAVGASNMTMAGDGAESSGILLRIPEIVIGPLTLKQVGVLGAGDGKGAAPGSGLFDWYSTKNAVPVIGWIGGNVLKNYRLTIDYSNQVMYWLKQAEPDPDELNQIGITLLAAHGQYFVEAIARKNDKPTIEGVSPGDRLIRIGDMEVVNATWGEIFKAMHGRPGEIRKLVLERNGRQLTIDTRVTHFDGAEKACCAGIPACTGVLASA